MGTKTDSEIMDQFPLLYKDRTKPMSQSLMCFGFEVEDGWLPFLEEMSAKLEKEIEMYVKQTGDSEDHARAAQVKSKFAGLRFYMDGNITEPMENIIKEYEKRSHFVCEECGESGMVRSGGWLKVLCDGCQSKRNSSV